MKKFFIILSLLFFSLKANAYVVDWTKTGKNEELITQIGFTLLNANRIPNRVSFVVKKDDTPNGWTYYRNNKIVITTGAIEYAKDEDEIAALLDHEISHAQDYRKGVLKGYFSCLLSGKKSEYKADKRGIDYMVKAGYNPLAMIILLNKITDQPRYDWYLSHPLGSRRLASIYEYIYSKYPQYLVQNKYKNDLVYQNFLLTSRENRKKLETKIKSKSKNRIKYL